MRPFSRRSVLKPVLIAAVASFAGPAEAAESGQQAPRKTTQSETYIKIEPMYASFLEGARPRGLLLVEIGLDVPDEKLRERANRAMPILRDAYIRNLLVYASTSVRAFRQPSIEDIAKSLQTTTDTVLGREGARVLMAQTAIRLNH